MGGDRTLSLGGTLAMGLAIGLQRALDHLHRSTSESADSLVLRRLSVSLATKWRPNQ
jgi:hypothetical protein